METPNGFNYAIAGSYASNICGVNDYLVYSGLCGNVFKVNSSSPDLWLDSIIKGSYHPFMQDVMWDSSFHAIDGDDDRCFKVWELKKKLYYEFPLLFAMRIASEIEVASLQVVIYQIQTESGKQWMKLHFSDRDFRCFETLLHRKPGVFFEDPCAFSLHTSGRVGSAVIRNSAPRLEMLALDVLIRSGVYKPATAEKEVEFDKENFMDKW